MNNTSTPPERRDPPRASDSRAAAAARRAELARRAEQKRREVRRARIELALIGAGILAAIIAIIVIISLAVRSHRAADETEAPPETTREPETVAVVEPETEPAETGEVEYAAATDSTRVLTDAEIASTHAIMIDIPTNTVIMTRNGDGRIYPASMTKIMTLIVAYENASRLEATFEMTENIIGTLWEQNATVAGFSVGEKVRLDDLMYGLILPSGADCAVALAISTAGSEEAFAALMNEKVKALGLKNTHFMNPTGLHDPEQYSTCHDIALILEYALRDDFMRKVLSTYEYTSHPTPEHPEGVTVRSTMQERMYGNEAPGMFIVGGKTGYTTEAKNCLASFAVRYDAATESEASVYEKEPEYIFVTADGNGKWVPIFDAINAYALVVDEDAMETKQYSGQ